MKLNFKNLFTNLLMIALVALVLVPFNAVAAGAVGSTLLFKQVLNVSFPDMFQSISGMAFMALETEVWVEDIEDELYAGNEFIMKSVNHNEFVSDLKVHIPNSGAAPNVEVNRSTVPATITQRTDNDVEYTLKEYTTDPVLVKDFEDIQNSYNKRQSVIGQHQNELKDRVALETAFAWAPDSATNKIVLTTGAASSDALADGATGTRLSITLDDIRSLQTLMNKDNVPKSGRYLLMDSELYAQLLASSDVLNRDFMNTGNLPEGVVNKVYGFNIMERSEVVTYDASNDPKAVGAATATTDNLGAIAWHESSVAYAKGETKVFAEQDKAAYYGSIFSSMVIHGASKLRSDFKGVAAIVQAP